MSFSFGNGKYVFRGNDGGHGNLVGNGCHQENFYIGNDQITKIRAGPQGAAYTSKGVTYNLAPNETVTFRNGVKEAALNQQPGPDVPRAYVMTGVHNATMGPNNKHVVYFDNPQKKVPVRKDVWEFNGATITDDVADDGFICSRCIECKGVSYMINGVRYVNGEVLPARNPNPKRDETGPADAGERVKKVRFEGDEEKQRKMRHELAPAAGSCLSCSTESKFLYTMACEYPDLVNQGDAVAHRLRYCKKCILEADDCPLCGKQPHEIMLVMTVRRTEVE